jgi:Spy/CpxP family protein refolding chaperone
MRTKIFASLALAALLAGSMQFAAAGENPPAPEDEISTRDFRHGPRRGHDGPGRHDRRGRHGEWRDGFHRGGPGGPGGRFADRPCFRAGWDCDDDDGPRGHRGPGRRGFRMHDDHGWGMGPGMGPMHGMGPMGFGHMAGVKLDDSQKAKLVDVMTANFRAGLEARMALRDAHEKLADLRDDKDASADAIVAANAAVGEAKGKLEVLRRKARDDFRGILTEDQIKQLDERREEMRELREKRREERRERFGDDARRGPPPPHKGPKDRGPDGERPSRPGPGPRR